MRLGSSLPGLALPGNECDQLFIALALLLIAAHAFGYLFHCAHMPRVIGEIVDG
jgi:Kef-type K+ transport system membrane component KefB